MKLLAAQFLRSGAVGLVGTATQYAVLITLMHGFTSNAVLASTLGAVLGALVNYLLNRSVTFKSKRPHREALPRFMIVAILGFVLNAGGMTWLMSLSLHYMLAQVVMTGTVLVFSFAVNRWWTFR